MLKSHHRPQMQGGVCDVMEACPFLQVSPPQDFVSRPGIASHASRHQLANENKLLKRSEELKRVVADDEAGAAPRGTSILL